MATILRPSIHDLTVQIATQSKEFREELNFESLMMILCNRRRHMAAIQEWQNRAATARKRSRKLFTLDELPCALRSTENRSRPTICAAERQEVSP